MRRDKLAGVAAYERAPRVLADQLPHHLGIVARMDRIRSHASSLARRTSSVLYSHAKDRLRPAGPLADRALHLELDQAVHLDRVLHRELLDDRLDEAVDDQLRGVFFGDSV